MTAVSGSATTIDLAGEADRQLKSRHAAMWASGDYPSVAREVIAELGPVLVEACGLGAGQRVLDVAAGAGNAAVAAARAGADVVASDLTPQLLAAGLAEHPELAGRLSWEEGDAEQLPYDDAGFDAVLSCVGVMFAPRHELAAAELVRVLKPGGRLGLIAWTPAGFIGRMFSVMKPYAPPPPPGASPAPLWGDPDHVTGLLSGAVTDIVAETRTLPVRRFRDGAEFRDFFKHCYGPTIAVYRGLADRSDDAAALDRALARLGDEALAEGGGADEPVMHWEYLLFTARRS